MRILIATDAWRPQLNGVVRTYERLTDELVAMGVEHELLTPNGFRTLPCPTYPEIRLAVPDLAQVARRFEAAAPSAVHIATEGPIGWMARRYCLKAGIPFTTSFHTRFPEYVERRVRVPARWTWAIERRFHDAGAGVMVATRSLAAELESRGFKRLLPWTRGVDTAHFRPRPVRRFGHGPVFLYVGRVAVEKNLESFLGAPLPGRKVVVGDGPALAALKARYPDAHFEGSRVGDELAECYASADVFVFPSRTDTFGIVLLEAMASGLPVAAYPVPGPIDIVANGRTGVLSENLAAAAVSALGLDRTVVRREAQSYSWSATAGLFLSNLETALFSARGRRPPARLRTLARKPTSA